MGQNLPQEATFNLWYEPWITVEAMDGGLLEVSMEQALLDTPTFRCLYDPSPLAIVGIHRLLVAVLQYVVNPKTSQDLARLWTEGVFPKERIARFGDQYAHRFDLYSSDAPFMQSADLPLQPVKRSQAKSVGYLFQEEPAGTAVTHYQHAYEDDHLLCSHCVAKGLVMLPAFASSGGAGIKPSINGVPPIYVLPAGETLFHSLAMSLITPAFQPEVADRQTDQAWWLRDPIVKQKHELNRVGYLHSLTFPARRVRLHPDMMVRNCTRCSRQTTWGSASMVFEMGESRDKQATFWRDPFAAYRMPNSNKDDTQPNPIRPLEGRPIWREFAGLFLPQGDDAKYYRPSVLNQIEEWIEWTSLDLTQPIPFQTTGLRTDMKMKIFEWEENGFIATPFLLSNLAVAQAVEDGIEYAVNIAGVIQKTFRQHFSGESSRSDKHQHLRQWMIQQYWSELAEPFRQSVLEFAPDAAPEPILHDWLDRVEQQALIRFRQVAETIGDDAVSLRQRVQAIEHCRNALKKYRNKTHPKE